MPPSKRQCLSAPPSSPLASASPLPPSPHPHPIPFPSPTSIVPSLDDLPPSPRAPAEHYHHREPGSKPRRAPARKWTHDEERLFCEALDLYGRDWRACAEHVRTRTPSDFRSHAQKYFIRLYKQGMPVPQKVAETGGGHTLSGKPLDPNSSAARCYLASPKSKIDHARSGTAAAKRTPKRRAQAGSPVSALSTISLSASSAQGRGHSAQGSTVTDLNVPFSLDVPASVPADPFEALRPADLFCGLEDPSPPPPPPPPPPPSVAEMDLDLSSSPVSSRASWDAGALLDSVLTDAAGSPAACPTPAPPPPPSPPPHVVVDLRVSFIMDIHANVLDGDAVDGFLVGAWDRARGVLAVTDAFPVLAKHGLPGNDPSKKLAENLLQAKHHVVGWYSSRPAPPPTPTPRDTARFRALRDLVRDKSAAAAAAPLPFVGVLLAPANAAQGPGTAWFDVDAASGGVVPVRPRSAPLPMIEGNGIKELLLRVSRHTEAVCKHAARPVTRSLEAPWARDADTGGSVSRIEAIRKVLLAHLDDGAGEFGSVLVEGVVSYLAKVWPGSARASL